jgi:hypothetical protein
LSDGACEGDSARFSEGPIKGNSSGAGEEGSRDGREESLDKGVLDGISVETGNMGLADGPL